MPEAMPWFSTQPKGLMIELWFLSVMRDRDLNAAQVRTAWALTFLFNSKTGKAWAGNEAIGLAIGCTAETVRKAVRVLVQHGHVIRTHETKKGVQIRILRPALANRSPIMRVGQGIPPSMPEGGTGRPGRVGHGIPPGVGQGVPHILRTDPGNDPGRVQDMALADASSEADVELDEDPPF